MCTYIFAFNNLYPCIAACFTKCLALTIFIYQCVAIKRFQWHAHNPCPAPSECNQSLCCPYSTHHCWFLSIHFHLQMLCHWKPQKRHYLLTIHGRPNCCRSLLCWFLMAQCTAWSLFAVMDHKLPSPIIWNQKLPLQKSEMESGTAQKLRKISTITLQNVSGVLQLLFDATALQEGVITTESPVWVPLPHNKQNLAWQEIATDLIHCPYIEGSHMSLKKAHGSSG